jgi:hypothetical protein
MHRMRLTSGRGTADAVFRHMHASVRSATSSCAALKARGRHPVVDFRDPDVVLVVEMVGDSAGLGLLTRDLPDAVSVRQDGLAIGGCDAP